LVKKKIVDSAILAEINKAAGRMDSLITYDDAVTQFLQHGEAKALSEYTLWSYAKELRCFRLSLVEQGAPLADIKSLQYEHYDYFIMNMRKNNYAGSTINQRLLTIKIFGNYCVRQHILDINHASEIPQLKVRKRIGDSFSKEQLRRLLDTPNINTFEGLRDLTIMTMFADTGIRLSELHAINVQDVLFEDNSVSVQRTKNRQARRIPLTKRLRTLLTAYIKVRGIVNLTDALFITMMDTRLARGSIEYQIRKHGKDCGIIGDLKCAPHTFRRTFAKFKIKAGVDIFTLQVLMGHSDISELRNYVAIYSTDLDDAIEKGID
jgi:integrase/recombinase XerD